MLEIGRDKLDNTLFLVKDGQNIANRIINFFDLEGINCLFISHSYKYSALRPNCSTKYYNTYYEEIPKLLAGNLFRVDVIIVSVDKNYPIVLESIRTITDLPIIFIGNDLEDFSYTKRYINDFKYVYQMYKDSKGVYSNIMMQMDENKWEENFLTTSYIKDIKNDWVTTLKDLITEYHRDKKIELILKNKEE
jgi:hypothetical protein